MMPLAFFQLTESDSTTSITVESVLNATWPLPFWLTFLIIAAVLALVGYLYVSERGSARLSIRLALISLRFVLLMLVLWMLAGWSWLRFKSEHPELVIVVDRSASMNTPDESLGREDNQPRLEIAKALFANLDSRQRSAFDERYQLKWYAVAEGLEAQSEDSDGAGLSELQADGAHSRLGDALSRLVDRQAGRGTAAVVFISDGITTSGISLADIAQKARRASIPFYTVLVGQQYSQPDLRLVDLLVDRQVFLGDQVTTEVSVVASDIADVKTKVTLRDRSNNRVLDSTVVDLSSGRNQQQVRLGFVPDRSGEIPLELFMEPVEGEVNHANNVQQASVLVQDKLIKVLMVFETPSYEFRFLKSLLERTQQVGEKKSASFALQSVLQDADPQYVEQDATALRLIPSQAAAVVDFDVFVFGDFDPSLVSRSSQQAIFDAVTNGGSGCIFIVGGRSPAIELQNWPLGKLLPAEIHASSSENARQSLANGPFRWQPTSLGTSALPMQLASSPGDSLNLWQQLPLLHTAASVEQLKPGAQVLANAIDIHTSSELPLLITQFAGAGRSALQATDETYLWSTYGGTDQYYERYWGQMLRWLSRGKLKEASGVPVLLVEPKQSKLGQPIEFQLTLSGGNRPTLPEPAEVLVESSDGVRRTLTLPRSERDASIYQASVKDFAPGSYRARLVRPNETPPTNAEFVVVAPPGEQANLRADQAAMQALAKQSRGRFFTSRNAEQLFDALPAGQPTRLGTLPAQPFWNSHLIALLFVLLLTSEWLLRRHARML
ncbi:MAG: vWA domain-containing protein [Pirellulaceae bacterium]